MIDEPGKQKLVCQAKPLESLFELLLHQHKRIARSGGSMLSRPQKVHCQRGDQRPRKDVRSHHREDHRLGERHEQVARHPVQEEHGNKDDRYAKSRDQGRYGNLLGAFQDRLPDFLPFTENSIDVLDLDSGVIHQDANRERQAAEGHHVDRFMQCAEHDNRSKDGKRNRDGDNQSAAPASEE